MTADSPIVAEVRARRMAISKGFNHDLKAYVEHVMQLQKEHKNRLVSQITVVPSTKKKS